MAAEDNYRSLIVILLACCFHEVAGNGRLIIPPQRSSIWRDSASWGNPQIYRNYNDHTLNCGGLWKRDMFDGKCGLCGDSWDIPEPRPNEAGGIYARGLIGRTYSTDVKYIDAEVQVTSSMAGFFEFRMCPNNDVTHRVTQECLDQHQLNVLSKDHVVNYGRRYFTEITPGRPGIVQLLLEIPEGMECTQCVLQWRWHGGVDFGICDNGRWGKGCGKQNEIFNCADIAILPPEVGEESLLPGVPTTDEDKPRDNDDEQKSDDKATASVTPSATTPAVPMTASTSSTVSALSSTTGQESTPSASGSAGVPGLEPEISEVIVTVPKVDVPVTGHIVTDRPAEQTSAAVTTTGFSKLFTSQVTTMPTAWVTSFMPIFDVFSTEAVATGTANTDSQTVSFEVTTPIVMPDISTEYFTTKEEHVTTNAQDVINSTMPVDLTTQAEAGARTTENEITVMSSSTEATAVVTSTQETDIAVSVNATSAHNGTEQSVQTADVTTFLTTTPVIAVNVAVPITISSSIIDATTAATATSTESSGTTSTQGTVDQTTVSVQVNNTITEESPVPFTTSTARSDSKTTTETPVTKRDATVSTMLVDLTTQVEAGAGTTENDITVMSTSTEATTVVTNNQGADMTVSVNTTSAQGSLSSEITNAPLVNGSTENIMSTSSPITSSELTSTQISTFTSSPTIMESSNESIANESGSSGVDATQSETTISPSIEESTTSQSDATVATSGAIESETTPVPVNDTDTATGVNEVGTTTGEVLLSTARTIVNVTNGPVTTVIEDRSEGNSSSTTTIEPTETMSTTISEEKTSVSFRTDNVRDEAVTTVATLIFTSNATSDIVATTAAAATLTNTTLGSTQETIVNEMIPEHVTVTKAQSDESTSGTESTPLASTTVSLVEATSDSNTEKNPNPNPEPEPEVSPINNATEQTESSTVGIEQSSDMSTSTLSSATAADVIDNTTLANVVDVVANTSDRVTGVFSGDNDTASSKDPSTIGEKTTPFVTASILANSPSATSTSSETVTWSTDSTTPTVAKPTGIEGDIIFGPPATDTIIKIDFNIKGGKAHELKKHKIINGTVFLDS